MDDNKDAPGWDRRTMFKGAAGVGAATVLASVLSTSHTASAAVDLGGTLDGIGNFTVLAFSWGASSAAGQRGASGSAGKPALQDLSLTKYTDATSPKILEALLKGTLIRNAVITIAPTNPNAPSSTYAMGNVLVSAYSSGGSGGEDQLTENISLRFTTLTYTVGGTSVVWP